MTCTPLVTVTELEAGMVEPLDDAERRAARTLLERASGMAQELAGRDWNGDAPHWVKNAIVTAVERALPGASNIIRASSGDESITMREVEGGLYFNPADLARLRNMGGTAPNTFVQVSGTRTGPQSGSFRVPGEPAHSRVQWIGW